MSNPSQTQGTRPYERRRDVVGYVLHVQLDDIRPAIWRQVQVPSDVMLDVLHDVLQIVMGWDGWHLHAFARNDVFDDGPDDRFVMEDDAGEGLPGIFETEVRLDEVLAGPGDRMVYEYDFGDSWAHTIRLEEVRPAGPEGVPTTCLGGERACPPEDCGGVPGYDHLCETASRLDRGLPVDPWPVEWLGRMFPEEAPSHVLAELERLDVDEVNARLEAARLAPFVPPLIDELADRAGDPTPVLALLPTGAAEVPEPLADAEIENAVAPFAWLVRHVGADGVALTSAGYLRPADVVAVAKVLGLADEWVGTLNRESHTPQVTDFREAAQELGLVRKAKGRLTATRAGLAVADDARGLWEHIADRLPLGRADHARDAGFLVLLDVAGRVGQPGAESAAVRSELVRDAMAELGWQRHDGAPLTVADVRSDAHATVVVLQRLGGFERERWRIRPDEPTRVGVAMARAALGLQE